MTRAVRILHRLREDSSGLALLEFAFLLPIFLTLSLVGAELTNYVITRMRVSQLALHLADNAARIGSGSMLQAKKISETDINDLLTGAGLQAGELDLYRRGRVVISSLEPMANPNVTGLYKIAWKRCRGTKSYTSTYTNVLTNINGGLGPTGRKVTAPDNGATMFIEVAYDYQPLVKTSYSPSTSMTEIASMMVRDRRDTSVGPGHLEGVYNTESAPVSSC